MTVEVTSTYVRLPGNGVSTVFNFPFKIFDDGDITVVDIDDTAPTAVPTTRTDFTVTISSTAEGGSITFVTAPLSAHTIDIRRNMAETQETDIRNQGRFAPQIHEDAFDKLTAEVQDLKRQVQQALRYPDYVDADAVMSPISSWASKYVTINADGEFEPAALTAGTLTQSGFDSFLSATSQATIGQLIHGTTSAETTAAAPIANALYVPGYVDRYGTNTTPGTTDMAAAFNTAYQVAKQTGCSVRWGATAPYRLNSPINCTQMRGVVSWDDSSKNLSAAAPSVIIAHDGQTYSHGFDLSASTEMVFNKVVAGNLAGKVPNSLFFMARNAVGSGAGIHRFNDCCTTFGSKFTNIVYSYGSEENAYTDCNFYQHQNGSNVISHNSNNPAGYTSSFVTISSSTALSNAGNVHRGSSYFNFGNSGSKNELVFNLINADNFKFRDGLWYCENGRAYMSVAGTTASNFLTLDSIRGEPSQGTKCTYAIDVQTTAATGSNSLVKWTLNNVTADTISHFLNFADTAELRDSTLNICSSTSGLLMNAYNLQNVLVNHGTSVIAGRVGGTVASCTFIGTRASITLSGTDTNNTGVDQANGRTWETGDSYTAASAACTGAITASAVWTIKKNNRRVTLSLPAIAATATAAATFTFGTVIPAAYRPAATLKIPIMILDNLVSPNQLGAVGINASTGAISVFKDVLGTGVFSTTASGEGLPGVTEVSWTI